VKYKPLGFCLYCGATRDLEDEHTLPFALQGSRVIPDATCRACASETSRIETDVLRGPLWPVRVFRNLKSRSKHKDAPSHLEFVIRRGSHDELLDLPVRDAPIFFLFPRFAPPGYLHDPPIASEGISLIGTDNVVFGKDPRALLREIGATAITIKQSQRPAVFARLVAKIALSTAFGERLVARVRGTDALAQSILGKTDDIGKWVGNLTGPSSTRTRALHTISFKEHPQRRLLLSEVHLFADSQAPLYTIVIGELL
jgi:hypothetical protein